MVNRKIPLHYPISPVKITYSSIIKQVARQDTSHMRRKKGNKTVALRAMSKALIVLLTFHWWGIPMVSCEEQSIL